LENAGSRWDLKTVLQKYVRGLTGRESGKRAAGLGTRGSSEADEVRVDEGRGAAEADEVGPGQGVLGAAAEPNEVGLAGFARQLFAVNVVGRLLNVALAEPDEIRQIGTAEPDEVRLSSHRSAETNEIRTHVTLGGKNTLISTRNTRLYRIANG